MALNMYDDMLQSDKDETTSPVQPKVPETKYDSIVQNTNAIQRSNLAAANLYAQEKEPSRMVKALQMAQDLGVDTDFADRNMEALDKRAKTVGVNYDSLIKDNPGAAAYLEKPENAAISRDDIESVKRIDTGLQFMPKRDQPNPFMQFAGEMHQAGDTGFNNLTSSIIGLNIAFGKGDRTQIEMQAMMNKRAKELSDKRPEYSKEFQATMSEEGKDVNAAWNQFLGGFKKWNEGKKFEAMKDIIAGDVVMVSEALDMIRHVAQRPRGLMYSVSENVVNSLPAIAGGFGGGAAGMTGGPLAPFTVPAGMAAGSFAGGGVTEVGAMINAQMEERGVDITDPDALEKAYGDAQMMADIRGAALRKGLTTAAIDSLFTMFAGSALSKVGKTAKVAGKTVDAAADTATLAGRTRNIVRGEFGETLVAGAKDTGKEMLGETISEAGGQLAQEKGDFSKIDISGALQEGITSLGQSMATATIAGTYKAEALAKRKLFHKDPMKAADQVVQHADSALESLQGLGALQDLGKTIKGTLNLKDVPGKISELVETATGGAGSKAVYFQVDEFDNHWNKKGESPAAKAGEIMGDGGKAYQEAKNTNGMIEIPLEQYAANVGPTQDFEELLPVTRVSPDGMNLQEARETMQVLPEMMKQVAAEATQAQEMVEPVEQQIKKRTSQIGSQIKDQLVAAGRPVREAKYAAAQAEAFFRTTAQRYGMSPEQFEDFFQKYVPSIRMGGEAQAAGDGQTFNQVATTTGTNAPQVSPLGFFSQVEAEVQKMDFGQMPGKDLSGRIRNIPGIKKEELEFLGLNEWLETQENKVTKEDVVNFIRTQGLQVDQIVLGETGSKTGNVEWGEKDRDTSGDSDEISNEMDYYLNDNKEWREEQEAKFKAELLEEYTDEDGDVDESRLDDAVEEKVRDEAERVVTEYIESDDYHNARFSVEGTAYDADGDEITITLNGNDESGWYGYESGEHYETDLNEAQIRFLADLAEKGKIQVDLSELRRAEDISWKYTRAKMPAESTLKKKVSALIKSDKERLLQIAKNDSSNEYLLKDFDTKTAKEQKEIEKEILEWQAKKEIDETYENQDSEKNEISTQLDHPIVSGSITGNNVKGWTLSAYGADEARLDQKLNAKTLDDAKTEATQLMIEKKFVQPFRTGNADEINKVTGQSKFSRYVKEGPAENYREFLLTLPKVDETFVYSGHFSQKNIVAHARVTDRVDAEGKKVLFVEEVQSDWHQQGREKGYKGNDSELRKERRGLESQLDEAQKEFEAHKRHLLVEEAHEDIETYRHLAETDTKLAELTEKQNSLEKRRQEITEQLQGVPDAPLKNTEAWAALVMKRMIRLAVEQGYDTVAWSPAAFQIERWGTDNLTWVKQTEGDQTYFLVGSTEQTGGMADGTNIEELARQRGQLLERRGQKITTKEELREVVQDTLGRQRSAEALGSLTDNIWNQMQDKETGVKAPRAEGMTAFYDKMIPKMVTGLLKKLDKEAKVDVTQIQTADTDLLEGEENRAFTNVLGVKLTPAIKQKAMEGFALFQGDPNTPLGQIVFGESGINIDLFRGANPSTFLHEMGHAYLKIMSDLQANENVPPQTKEDFAAILNFLEVEGADKIGTDQHEKFARAFESYLREGKAPSNALRKAFANFKTWLLTVYRNVMNLNVEVSPEMKKVFDRMLATEDEIAEAMGLITGDMDMEKLGATSEKQLDHMNALAMWKMQAEEELSSRVMEDYERAKTAEYRERRKLVEAEVTAKVNQLVVYKAISMLQNGTMPDGSPLPEGTASFKLERSSLIKMFGQAIVDRLPPRVISPIKEGGGMNVELAAGMLGFEDADQMIQALANMPKKTDYIAHETDKQMQRDYPDIYNDESPEEIKAAAMDYVHSDMGARVKRMQLEMIAEKAMPLLKEGIRQVAKRPPSTRQMQAEALRVISQKKVSDVRPIVFLRAERKAAKEAGVALARGDFARAYELKRQELYNYELYRTAVKFNDMFINRLGNFRKMLKSDEKIAKTRDMDIVAALRAILSQYGVGRKGKDPMEYLNKLKAYDPDTYETVAALIEGSLVPANSFDSMTVDDFTAVSDAVFSMWDLSKTSMEHIVDGQSRNREELINELNEHLAGKTTSYDRAGYDKKATTWEKTKIAFISFRAALRRVESWADATDGDDSKKPFRRYIWNPISEALGRYRELRTAKLLEFLELTKTLDRDVFEERFIGAPELKRTDPDGVVRHYKFSSVSEIIGAMLHLGNESNKKKLLVGRQWGAMFDDGSLNSTNFDAFFDRMHKEGIITKAHWDYVQSVWDLMESLKPDAQKAHKRMYGFFFNEVTAQAVKTPFGNYRGGYAPAVADTLISEGGKIKSEQEALEKMNNSFMFPTTGRGFTKKRVENYATPLSIDLRLVPSHIDKVMRFSHVEPHVKSVGRIVMNKEFRAQLAAFDPAVGAEMLVPWLQRSALQRVSTPSTSRWFDNLCNKVRSRAGMNAMFLNITNALQQFTGWSVSLVKVKPKHLRNALWTYTRSPRQTAEAIMDKSDFMRARMDSEVSFLQRNIEELLTDPNQFEQLNKFAEKHAYVLQSTFQNIVDATTWLGAYEQAIEANANEVDAVREADSAVRSTQGSLFPEDVSRYETGTPFHRIFTMFYSYFNNLANTLGTEFVKTIRDTGLKKGMPRLLYVYMFGYLVPAMMSEMIVRAMQGKGIDEDDDDQVLDDMMAVFFGSQFRTGTAMMPIAGPLAAVAYNQFDNVVYNDRISTSPAISTLESTIVGNAKNIYTGVFTDKEVNKKKAFRDALSAFSLMSGIPTGQIGKTGGYMIDVSEGKTDPETAIEAVQGAVTGKAPQ